MIAGGLLLPHPDGVVIHLLPRLILTLQAALRDAARALHIRLPSDLGSELEELGARGLRIVFVFSRNDPGIDPLNIQTGSSIRRLGERCRRHIIEGGDHTFTDAASRGALQRILSEEIYAREVTLGGPADG